MKKVLLWVLLIAVSQAGGGCAFMNPEDRDFYGKGWVHPTDLDREPPHHTIPDPSRPQTTTTTTAAPSQTAPASEADPEWIVPVPGVR